MSQRVVIAGGGLTGLTAAYRIQQKARAAGADVEIILFEKDQVLGGKTQTTVKDGVVIEHGPDSFVATKPQMRELCQELGVPLVGTNPRVTSTYILHKGRLESLPVGMQLMIPTEVWPFVTTRLISPAGKVRAALEPFVPIKRDASDESIGSFVRRRFGQEVLEHVAGPLMGGIHGGDYDAVSIKSTFPMFPQMEREKGSLLLAARRQKRERKAATPKGPTGFSTFMTVPTGLKGIVDALAARCEGVRVRTGVALTAVKRGSGGGYEVALDTGERLAADAVVLALPAFAIAALVQEPLPEVAAIMGDVPYGNSTVVALTYNRADIDHPLAASGFLVPPGEGLAVQASTWVSSKWEHAAPPDKVLLRVFMGRSRNWVEEPDEAVLAAVRRDLEQIMGLKAKPVDVQIFRWPRAMVQYRVGHLAAMDRVDELMAKAPGLYLAGAAFRGVGLPDCVREGTQAAEQVARQLGWV